MGLFSSESTSTPKFSPGVDKLHDQIIGGATTGMSPWLTNPKYQVAPINQWQEQVGTGIGGLLGAMAPNFSQQAAGLFGSMGGNMGRSFTGDFMSQMGRGQAALSPASQFATVDPSEIYAAASPLEDMLNESGMRQMQRGYQTSSADIANDEAAQNAFSGSSSAAALRRSELDTGMRDSVRDMTAGNAATAYQMGGQIASQNTAAENARNQFLSQMMNQSAGMDLAALGQAQGAESDYLNRQLGARGFDLSALGAAEGLLGGYSGRQTGALSLLGAYGDQRQQHAQSTLDAPYTQASRFAGYVPGISPATTTENSPSWLQTGGNILSSLIPFF